MSKLQQLIEIASKEKDNFVAVAAAADPVVLEAIRDAVKIELACFRLFDDQTALLDLIDAQFPELKDHPSIQIQHVKSKEQAAHAAVKSVFLNEANVLMKGNIPTATILKVALHPEYGLRTGKVLSHVAAFEVKGFDRLIFVTDAAMNILPSLEQKAQIIENAVKVARSVGVDKPVVVPLAAIETVNPAMQPTLDAAALVLMNQRGQIRDCIVDGPLALDNAISMQAAAHKGLNTKTAGQADILVVPNIEAGNILYKSLVYFAKAKVGGIIEGARSPIVLTSRADSADTKLYSLALAICSSKNKD